MEETFFDLCAPKTNQYSALTQRIHRKKFKSIDAAVRLWPSLTFDPRSVTYIHLYKKNAIHIVCIDMWYEVYRSKSFSENGHFLSWHPFGGYNETRCKFILTPVPQKLISTAPCPYMTINKNSGRLKQRFFVFFCGATRN